MKQTKNPNLSTPYATNKGGKISCPKGAPKDEPRATTKAGNDLRVKRG
jgi:hypothetical protein